MEQIITNKSGKLSKERREFLKKTGSIAVMSMFGVSFFTSCASDEDTNPSNSTPNNPPASSTGITVNNNSVVIDLTQATSLNNAGGWVLVISAQMLVVNTGSGFSALTSICTHSGCDRQWSLSSNEFVCACHGSRFTTSGAVVQGPASQPLASFQNSRTGDILTINRV
jgi:Rieske Fe-S protein